MYFRVILFLLSLSKFASCNRERKISEILETVQRIEEQLKKEERLREITDIVRVDSTLDRLSKKLDRVVDMLETSSPPSPRSSALTAAIPRDLVNNIEVIDNRLSGLENSVTNMEQSMGKLDIEAAKIEEIEHRTTQLKDDMNTKLRKIMNVITALYEMNKDMKVNMGCKSDAPETSPSGSSSSFATEFLVENLEEMERKIKEQFSILSSEMRSQITSLKIMTSAAGSKTETDDEDEWMTPEDNIARSISPANRDRQAGRSVSKVENTLDNLMESLGRTTREIREEIHQGMQGIDDKLGNLTALARSQPRCEHMQASESVVSSWRAAPRARLPQQAVEDKKSARSASCTKSSQNTPSPKSCADLRKGGATCDGVYVIFPKSVRAVRVLCDMTTDGGGWTVVMRRGDFGDKMTGFHKNWASYKNGFGDVEGEFWIGNDVMNLMTTEEENVLRVHLSSFDNDEVNLDYASFSVGNESDSYRLQIGIPVGENSQTPAANSLRYHNNHPFSTFDRQNDDFTQNCAATYKGGWWFNGCYFGFLTGEYFKESQKRETWQGILWYDWKGNQSLKGAEMLIRPKNFLARS